jgi:hypothetical protein
VNAEWAVNKLKVATYELDFLGHERPTTRFSGVGTSYAAPVVAGFISLWLSHHPDKTVADFLTEKPKFVRSVEPLAHCMECRPLGLVSVDRLGGSP